MSLSIGRCVAAIPAIPISGKSTDRNSCLKNKSIKIFNLHKCITQLNLNQKTGENLEIGLF